jgi:hypothetical protein
MSCIDVYLFVLGQASVKKETESLVDCSIKKADQNGVQDETASASPCSERSMEKEAQEMIAALELRIKEEPVDEEEVQEEEDRAEGGEGICDGGLHMNGGSYRVISGELYCLLAACSILS